MAPHRSKDIPCCTIVLVSGAVMCHWAVLIGNLAFSDTMETMGDSSRGWSRVGIGLARSLHDDIDLQMSNVSDTLVAAIDQIVVTQDAIEFTLAMIGNATDHAMNETLNKASLLQFHSSLLQLQKPHSQQEPPSDEEKEQLQEELRNILDKTINETTSIAVENIAVELDKLWELLKPGLEQIGDWLVTFGDEVQAGIQQATNSLDKVQKVFDSVMEQLNGRAGGDAKETMCEQTFNLFDVSGTGKITVQDLLDVADLYSIGALAGSKADDMVDKYDDDGDHKIDYDEFHMFVEDSSLDNIMSTVLRIYAERLAEIGGQIGNAKMRDEVSTQVVDYLSLVAAKNYTKVTWISDALSNGSLVMEFTSQVYAQLCLKEDDPNKLTEADVGAMVIGCMYGLNQENTEFALKVMREPNFWITMGYDPLDQAKCVARVQEWLDWAEGNSSSSLLQVDHEAKHAARLRMKAAAARRMRSHLHQRGQQKVMQRQALLSSRTARLLHSHLLGSGKGGSGLPSPADQASAAGAQAMPSTLEWAGWLSNNATVNADIFQGYSFDYSSTSSNNLETIGAKFEGMINKIKGFLDTMYDYSTAAGIARLEDMIADFRENGLFDIAGLLKEKLKEAVNETVPDFLKVLHDTAGDAGDWVSKKGRKIAQDPAAKAMVDPVGDVLAKALETTDVEGARSLSKVMVPAMADKVFSGGEQVAGDLLGELFKNLTDKAIMSASKALNDKISKGLSLMQARGDGDEDLEFNVSAGEPIYSASFQLVIDTLDGMLLTLPTASSMMKSARKGASKTTGSMDSIFKPFEDKGPKIFFDIADLWTLTWTLEVGFFIPLTALFLLYGLWASGWFGGPRPQWYADEPETPERPRTVLDKVSLCCTVFCNGCASFHDLQSCFWLSIVIMQIIVLLLFIISIVLCIVAGVQASILSGCEQVYVLNDLTICTELVTKLRNFTETFFVSDPSRALDDVCDYNKLNTCDRIEKDLKDAMVYITVFSFLGTILTLEMLVDAAQLHEMARFRRLLANRDAEKDYHDQQSAQASATRA